MALHALCLTFAFVHDAEGLLAVLFPDKEGALSIASGDHPLVGHGAGNARVHIWRRHGGTERRSGGREAPLTAIDARVPVLRQANPAHLRSAMPGDCSHASLAAVCAWPGPSKATGAGSRRLRTACGAGGSAPALLRGESEKSMSPSFSARMNARKTAFQTKKRARAPSKFRQARPRPRPQRRLLLSPPRELLLPPRHKPRTVPAR